MSEPILEVDDLTIQYRTDAGPVTAVSDASFTIGEGEYFGLVGESGCGKSTIANAVLGGLDPNGEVVAGSIRYRGQELQDMSESELNAAVRWDEIAWIPQGSMNSLNPLETISEQAFEIAKAHTDMTRAETMEKFRELFEIVGLNESRIDDYPHQFSGGMQQRAIIALSLLLDPSLIVADEPTTALDVIMQDQIFKYLDRIKTEMNTSMLMITHDISVIFESCDRLAIMHAGQIGETGTTEQLYDDPRHPYSILLQGAFPDIRQLDRELATIEGHPPQNIGDVTACTFADRCPWAVEECRESAPELEPVSDADEFHRGACFRKDEIHELIESEGGDVTSYETGAVDGPSSN
ncbi:ABC transporter ATP-binding protein [Haloarcula marina]|uniref:ABC transporter ATP-binding protein n=1 Tax=Haloarcula marina TaxID=2961574 RepID=UPI0020B68205|nr:ABC transporter ATP-binding protein [Halomicroarcula marina]